MTKPKKGFIVWGNATPSTDPSMKPILYTLTQRDPNGHYPQFVVTLLEHRPFTKPKDNNCAVSADIKWQNDRDTREWYGRRVEISLDSHEGPQSARLTRIAKLIARILPEGGRNTPQLVLDTLNQLGAVRVAYDGRLSRYVTEADRPDPALLYWMDDYRALGTQGCTVSCLALDVADAKVGIAKEFAALSRRADVRKSDEVRWIAAGKPVISSRPSDSRPAEFPSVESLLAASPTSGSHQGARYALAA